MDDVPLDPCPLSVHESIHQFHNLASESLIGLYLKVDESDSIRQKRHENYDECRMSYFKSFVAYYVMTLVVLTCSLL